MTAPAPTLADLLTVAERVEVLARAGRRRAPAGSCVQLRGDHDICPSCSAEYQDLRTLARAVRALVGVAEVARKEHSPFVHDKVTDEKRCAHCRALAALDAALR